LAKQKKINLCQNGKGTMVIISNFATCSHNILEILLVSYECFIISIIVNYVLSNHPTKKRPSKKQLLVFISWFVFNTTIDSGW
jgi:hypothetical protein